MTLTSFWYRKSTAQASEAKPTHEPWSLLHAEGDALDMIGTILGLPRVCAEILTFTASSPRRIPDHTYRFKLMERAYRWASEVHEGTRVPDDLVTVVMLLGLRKTATAPTVANIIATWLFAYRHDDDGRSAL